MNITFPLWVPRFYQTWLCPWFRGSNCALFYPKSPAGRGFIGLFFQNKQLNIFFLSQFFPTRITMQDWQFQLSMFYSIAHCLASRDSSNDSCMTSHFTIHLTASMWFITLVLLFVLSHCWKHGCESLISHLHKDLNHRSWIKLYAWQQ